jgi:hypothetical protein
MRTLSISLVALAGALGLAACAAGGYSGSYDGYYDNYYGPVSDGYWGRDGYFYFSVGDGRSFRRDDGFHFRRRPRSGFHHFHGSHRAGDRGE